jgi:hypothetical protein
LNYFQSIDQEQLGMRSCDSGSCEGRRRSIVQYGV